MIIIFMIVCTCTANSEEQKKRSFILGMGIVEGQSVAGNYDEYNTKQIADSKP